VEETSVNGSVPEASGVQWEQAAATLDALLEEDTDQEKRAWNWQLIAFGAMALAVASMGLAYVGWLTRPEVMPFVQLVQVDDQGRAQMRGEPMAVDTYRPQEGQWVQMLGEWVMRLRWRGVDKPQAQQAWTWLEMHSCGAAREQLSKYFEAEKPLEQLGVKKRQLTLKNILKSDMPHAWTVLWEELEINGPQAPVTTVNSGTFTVGRRKVASTAMRLHNPLGLCVTGFHWGVQP
jgi:type IV secretory pathway TrbF-like protein